MQNSINMYNYWPNDFLISISVQELELNDH